MFRFPTNFYADWRVRGGIVPALHENSDVPPERLLQAIWLHQRLRRDELHTLDGRRVQILHPGFINREAGPDFRDAVIQFGDETPRVGDVEVDLQTNGWRQHAHDRNPAFQNVILHVVWEGNGQAALSTLLLPGVLDAPVNELATWLGGEDAGGFPAVLAGQCSAPLRGLSAEQLDGLLREAALVRLQSKAAQLGARARQAGWQQSLWEGVFRALGYKHNGWPMQRLAELRSRLHPTRTKAMPLEWQARLLGTAGLLPEELSRTQAGADNYLRRLWDLWWREREEFNDCVLPRPMWRFSGLRPANHPQRRLALAAHWLSAGDLPARLERWCAAKLADGALARALAETLQVGRDDFWSWHWTLRSPRLSKAQPLLGAARVTDLAMNAVLPWLWARAVEGKNEPLRDALADRYLVWPRAEDNAVLRLARERLLGGASRRAFRTAAAQQGLLQIVRDFCAHSNALCERCRFPELIRQWEGGPMVEA